MKLKKIFYLVMICFAIISMLLNAAGEDEENIKIVSLDYKELGDGKGTEFTVKTEYCLPNSKLIVNVQQKKSGAEEVFELPRISYNSETLDAVFQGIIPYNKSDIKLKFIIQNFVERRRINDISDLGGEDEQTFEIKVEDAKTEEKKIDMISEMEQRAKIEEAANAEEEDYGSQLLGRSVAGSEKKGEGDDPMQDPEGQNVLLITAIFPMLFREE